MLIFAEQPRRQFRSCPIPAEQFRVPENIKSSNTPQVCNFGNTVNS
jgi:hypothetical protein